MKSQLSMAALAVLFVLVALANRNASAAEEPFRLGVALGFTGTGAPYSREGLEGIEMAVDEINGGGGLLGRHPIDLFTRNTKTRPEVAVGAAENLIRDHRVSAIIGTYSSAPALAIKPICRKHKVLHIATISNAEDITRLDPSPYTFSVVPNTYMMSKAVATGIARLAVDNGWKRYVTVASDYAWGRSSQETQVAQLARLAPHIELIDTYWPPIGHVGFNVIVADIRNQKPDFVLGSIAGGDQARWNLAIWDYRLIDEVAVPGGLISVTELVYNGDYIRRGTYARTRAPFFAHLDVPAMTAFVDRYRLRYDRYPSDWAVLSYDGVHALRQGAEAAQSIDPDVIKDAMKGLAIETTRGRLSFRPIDNQLDASAYLGRVADDPRYDFPIYSDLVEYKGPDIWRPEAEIRAARGE